LISVALALAPATVSTQSAEPAAVKAAFLLNFARFIDWPEEALPQRARQVRFCVLGDDNVADALQRLLTAPLHRGPELLLVRLGSSGARDPRELKRCQVLFVSGAERSVAEAAVEQVSGSAVLTVSDLEGFSRIGIAELYLENERMRFALNIQHAQRAGLKLGSPLLKLARVDKDPKP
jgi:hypothetical protein